MSRPETTVRYRSNMTFASRMLSGIRICPHLRQLPSALLAQWPERLIAAQLVVGQIRHGATCLCEPSQPHFPYWLWKKLSGIFFPSATCSSKGSKLDRSTLIKPYFDNGQLCKRGGVPPWCFSPVRHFLSITTHFSNDFAPLRCSKFIIFTQFLVLSKNVLPTVANTPYVRVKVVLKEILVMAICHKKDERY